MFFSLHSMTCSISSLGGIMSGGDFVLPKIGGAFVRGDFVQGGFCPVLHKIIADLALSSAETKKMHINIIIQYMYMHMLIVVTIHVQEKLKSPQNSILLSILLNFLLSDSRLKA